MLKVLIILVVLFIVLYVVYRFLAAYVAKETKSTFTDEELDKFFDPRYNR